jgi:hypothetical protein
MQKSDENITAAAEHDSSPQSLSEILAAVAARSGISLDEALAERPTTEPAADPDLYPWLAHETSTLREGVYRVETGQPGKPVGTRTTEQLNLIRYEYPSGVAVLSQYGELRARDLRVMAVVTRAFYELGCPPDNMVRGDEATLGFIARQLGMNPDGSVNDIRQSIERLATAKLVWREHLTKAGEDGSIEETESRELAHGFLAGWAKRERKRAGEKQQRDNYLLLDQHMAELIRRHRVTWLRADVMRKLRNHALATKLYAFMRSHRPNPNGHIEYGLVKLAERLGCGDTNRSRLRRKLREAAEVVCAVSPDEFPRSYLREGIHDQVLVMHRAEAKHSLGRGPSEVAVMGRAEPRVATG